MGVGDTTDISPGLQDAPPPLTHSSTCPTSGCSLSSVPAWWAAGVPSRPCSCQKAGLGGESKRPLLALIWLPPREAQADGWPELN